MVHSRDAHLAVGAADRRGAARPGRYRANREAAEKRAEERRRYAAGLGRRIARTQREIARTDAALGLGSAPLSAVNADTLERLAKVN